MSASAHGILAQARILGGSFGIAVSTACLHHFVINRLIDILPADEFASFDGDMTHFKGDSLEAIQSAIIAAFNRSVELATAGCWAAFFSTFYGYPITRRGAERQRDEDFLELEQKIAELRTKVDHLRNANQLEE